ncbi:MAG: hypothetical protein NDJ89_14120 [Oligoflexia bacterium]|nr:hypothetical protein [Oligoflexia bacterium]
MKSRQLLLPLLAAITGLVGSHWALGGPYYNLGAFLQSNLPAALIFTTTSPTLNTWSCTSKTVRRVDRLGRPSTFGVTSITLEGNNASFYSNSSCLPSTAITSLTISAGSSTAAYYVSYSTSGSQSTTVSSGGLTSASQSSTVSLDPYTWTGGGGNSDWTTGANWSGGSAPGTTATALFDSNCSTNCSPTINSSAISVKGIRINPGYSGTITQASGISFVACSSAGGFIQEGGTFVGSDGDITCSASFHLSGGTFTSTSGTLSLAGNLTVTGTPSFSAGGGTFLLTGTTATVTPGNLIFNHFTFQKSGAVTLTGSTLKVAGNLTQGGSTSNGVLTGGTIEASGNVTASGTNSGTASNTTVINLVGTNPQTVTGTAGSVLPSITIASPGGVTLSGTIDLAGSWTYTSGTVTAGTSLVRFLGAGTNTINAGSMAFNDVTFSRTQPSTITGTMNVAGDLTIGSSTLNSALTGGTISVSGDVTANGTNNGTAGQTTEIRLVGTGAQTLSGIAGSYLPSVAIASSGTVTVSGTIEVVRDWSYISGTVSAAGSLVQFRGSASSNIDSGEMSFGVVTFMKSAAATITGTMNVAGSLSLSGSTSSGVLTGGIIAVSGDVTANGTNIGTPGHTTDIHLVGAGTQTLSGISGSYFPSITIASSGTVNLSGSIIVASSWTYTSGTVAPGTSAVTFKGSGASTISGAMTFKHLDIGKGAIATTISGTISVTGNLALTTSNTAPLNGGTIAVSGDVTGSCTSTVGGNAVIKLVGTGPQALSSISGCYLPSIEIASSGTVSFSGTFEVTGNWTYTSGTVNAGTSLVQFRTAIIATIDAGSMSFYDVTFKRTTSISITGTLKISRNFVMDLTAAAGMNGGGIEVGGNVTLINNSGGTTTTTLSFVGSGAQSYSYAAGSLPRGNVTVNKPSGTLTLQGNMTLGGASQAFTISSGTVNLNGYTLSVGSGPAGPMSVTGSSSVLQCAGGCGAGTACGQGLGKLACGSLSVTSGGTVTP